MNLNNRISMNIVQRTIVRSLTGRVEDLYRVMRLARRFTGPKITAFMRNFAAGHYKDSGFARLFLRLGTQANAQCKKALVRNLVCNWGIAGANARKRFEEKGTYVPSFVVISPSMRCNLRCTGCYAGLYAKDGELSETEIDRVLTEMKSFGSYFAVISGGEPYIMSDVLLRLFRKHSDMYFMTYTNGTLLTKDIVAEMAELGNVAPAISVEGYKGQTDRRRGDGTFERASAAMARLREAGVPFGISVTYTSENAALVASEGFVRYFIQRGALFGWYFMFMPVGRDPLLSLVPSPRQRAECGDAIAELRQRFPIFLADFWNDGPSVGGCLAGGRQYLHILNSGRVEPCVFAHFGVDTIKEKTVLEAANSPFFQSIRSRFPYNANANLKMPCMIIDNPEVLRAAVAEHLIPAGHTNSEDLISDPKTVQWVDSYSRMFRQIVDPAWEAEISQPDSRWYRNGPEYKSLFTPNNRFGEVRLAVGSKSRKDGKRASRNEEGLTGRR